MRKPTGAAALARKGVPLPSARLIEKSPNPMEVYGWEKSWTKCCIFQPCLNVLMLQLKPPTTHHWLWVYVTVSIHLHSMLDHNEQPLYICGCGMLLSQISISICIDTERERETEWHRLTLSIPGPGNQMTLVPGLYSKRFEMSLVKSQSTYQTYSRRIYI